MAYFSQAQKAAIAPAIKAICKKYGVSASLSVRDMSEVVLSIKSGVIDFIGVANEVNKQRAGRRGEVFRPINNGHIQVNQFYIREGFPGVAGDFLSEVYAVMNSGNHDRSDSQSDYFDCGFYVSLNIGRWDKPYELKAA